MQELANQALQYRTAWAIELKHWPAMVEAASMVSHTAFSKKLRPYLLSALVGLVDLLQLQQLAGSTLL